MNYPLDDEVLLISSPHSFLLAAKVKETFCLCIETSKDEYCLGVSAGDLVVVSAPEGGSVEPALLLVDLVRRFHIPLLVLPKEHPGSRRIRYVVSVGPEIFTSCSIQRGTHPDQDLICSGEELSGMMLIGKNGGVEISPMHPGIMLRYIKYDVKTEFSCLIR
jgi:hypothetical protein